MTRLEIHVLLSVNTQASFTNVNFNVSGNLRLVVLKILLFKLMAFPHRVACRGVIWAFSKPDRFLFVQLYKTWTEHSGWVHIIFWLYWPRLPLRFESAFGNLNFRGNFWLGLLIPLKVQTISGRMLSRVKYKFLLIEILRAPEMIFASNLLKLLKWNVWWLFHYFK